MKTKRNMIALWVGIIWAIAWCAVYTHNVYASSTPPVTSSKTATLILWMADINMDVVDHKDDGSKLCVADDEDG